MNYVTLSNGVKVYLRHSDVKPNEIRISATSPGGYSINYSPEKVSTLRMLNEVISESAWGNYTKDELKKLLVGTNVNVTTGIELTEERLSAKASPDDLVTAMQLINLKMTSISRDDNAFDNLISSARTRIENQNSNPRYEMADSIFRYVYSHHPLAAKITAAELSDVSYDDVIGIKDKSLDNTLGVAYIYPKTSKSTKDIIDKLGAKICFEQKLEDGISYYGYVRGLDKSVDIQNKEINVQIVSNKDNIIVGFPLIMGSY